MTKVTPGCLHHEFWLLKSTHWNVDSRILHGCTVPEENSEQLWLLWKTHSWGENRAPGSRGMLYFLPVLVARREGTNEKHWRQHIESCTPGTLSKYPFTPSWSYPITTSKCPVLSEVVPLIQSPPLVVAAQMTSSSAVLGRDCHSKPTCASVVP